MHVAAFLLHLHLVSTRLCLAVPRPLAVHEQCGMMQVPQSVAERAAALPSPTKPRHGTAGIVVPLRKQRSLSQARRRLPPTHHLPPQLLPPNEPATGSALGALHLIQDASLLKTGMFIDGQWQEGGPGSATVPASAAASALLAPYACLLLQASNRIATPLVQVENPATGRELSRVCRGGAEEARAVVAAAAAAFPAWSKLAPGERADALLRFVARWHGISIGLKENC